MNNNMEVYGVVKQKVNINPKEVIEGLIIQSIGHNSWVFIKNNKYYKGFEKEGGSHSWDDEEEISKELYDYINALSIVLKKLNE